VKPGATGGAWLHNTLNHLDNCFSISTNLGNYATLQARI
jgi:hypothetical protein